MDDHLHPPMYKATPFNKQPEIIISNDDLRWSICSCCWSWRMRRKGEHLSSFFSFLSAGSHLGFQFLFVLLSTISSSSHPPSRLQVQISMIYWIAVANKGKGMSNGGLGSNRTTATEETTIIIFVKVFHSKFHIIIIFVCSRRSLMSANASLETVCWFLSFPTSLRSSRETRQTVQGNRIFYAPTSEKQQQKR